MTRRSRRFSGETGLRINAERNVLLEFAALLNLTYAVVEMMDLDEKSAVTRTLIPHRFPSNGLLSEERKRRRSDRKFFAKIKFSRG